MKDVTTFLFELGHLKRVPRSGWSLVGIERPESVADHSFRTAVLGYVLAVLEDADPARTALICLFHDAHEARVGDLHHVGQAYADWDDCQQRANEAMLQKLPDSLERRIGALVREGHARESLEACLARDADRLELLLQAVEYRAAGTAGLDDWIASQIQLLEYSSSREIAAEAVKPGAQNWWTGLIQ